MMMQSSPSSIDTAVVYKNEQHIGEALTTLLPKYNLQRQDIFITSKLSKFFSSSAVTKLQSKNVLCCGGGRRTAGLYGCYDTTVVFVIQTC